MPKDEWSNQIGMFNKVEKRVNSCVPDWKEWPRRLRRIYASLEDWGSTESAIEDMVAQWGWKQQEIDKLRRDHPSFKAAVEAYREDGNYPTVKEYIRLTHTHLKTVYIREGEFSSFATLDESDKSMAFHQTVVSENGMLSLSEPYIERRDLERDLRMDKDEEKEDLEEAGRDSGLKTFQEQESHA